MTQEVKPSQIAQLMMENQKLKEEIEKLNKMKSIKWSREFACPQIKKLTEERDFYIQRLKDVSSENTCPIIKELKEENEKLKEELTTTTIALNIVRDENEVNKKNGYKYREQIEKLKNFHFTYDKNVWSPTELLRILDNYDLNWNEVCEEVKKLNEENEKLKQYALKVHNFAHGTEWDDEDIVSAMDFDGIIEKMKKDEKDLKEEIKKLKE